MFPVSWPLLVIFLLMHALAGMAVGALTGWLVCQVAKIRPRALVADGLLGIFGYFAGFAGCVLFWPKNTIPMASDQILSGQPFSLLLSCPSRTNSTVESPAVHHCRKQALTRFDPMMSAIDSMTTSAPTPE
jgi:hypothetical protein